VAQLEAQIGISTPDRARERANRVAQQVVRGQRGTFDTWRTIDEGGNMAARREQVRQRSGPMTQYLGDGDLMNAPTNGSLPVFMHGSV